METLFSTSVTYDLLRVGHCTHPECIVMRRGRYQSIEFPSLVGLIEHPTHGLILYDTGYARHFHEATRRFPECLYRAVTPVTLSPEEELLTQLESRGISPSDIETIVISHFHADHIAGLRDFPQARFIATKAERNANESRSRLARLRHAYLRDLLPPDFEDRVHHAEDCPILDLPESWSLLSPAWDLLGDASLLGLHLPGHTESQLGLAIRSHEGRLIFFVGDAVWKIEALSENRRPSRFAYSLFSDPSAYDSSFTKLRSLYVSASAPLIIPSHCLDTWQNHGGTRRISRA